MERDPGLARSVQALTRTPAGTAADVVIVGAGIVGLATARALLHHDPAARVVVLEKEDHVAAHQSGHNSGVIHAGVYYKPGSSKAALCRDGRAAMIDFCAEHGIAHEVCGKVVVATSAEELPRLEQLRERSIANGLDVRLLDRQGLAELEPHADGLAALHVPATGVVDFREVCRVLAADVTARGAELRLGTAVTAIDEAPDEVIVGTSDTTIRTRLLVNCAGLHSDRVARLVGADHTGAGRTVILPFRGEYHELVPQRAHLVRHLIYPVPDPRFPFLGVHFTRDIAGAVHAGPNAVLALGRESYRWRTIVPRDVAEALGRPATWRLARRHHRTGAAEVLRSASTTAFVRALQRLVPDVRAADLVRAGAGVRAQAVAPDGTLLDDFAFVQTDRTLHVLNAPSPAATASLAIGAHIADRVRGLGAR